MKNFFKRCMMLSGLVMFAVTTVLCEQRSKPSTKKVCCHKKKVVTKKQYQTLLNQLYEMQSSLQKIKSSKKYTLLSLQVRHMLHVLKSKYPYNRLPVRKYRMLCKKANKVKAEINHIAQLRP